MLMDLTHSSKDTVWQTGLKRKIHLIDRNKHWLRVKGWKKIYQANGPLKQAGVSNTYIGQRRHQTYIDQTR
jgi:hypothetical protein